MAITGARSRSPDYECVRCWAKLETERGLDLHLAYFVSDVIDQLDLRAIEKQFQF